MLLVSHCIRWPCTVRGESWGWESMVHTVNNFTNPSLQLFLLPLSHTRGLCSLIMFQCLIISNRGGNRFPIVASQFEQPAFPALLYVMSRVALTKRFVAWHLSRLIIPFAEAGSSVDFHGFLSVRIWSHVVKLHSPAIAWMAESYLTGMRSTKDLRAGCKTQKHMTSCSNLQPTHLLLHVRFLF